MERDTEKTSAILREITSVLDKRYRAILWMNRDIKSYPRNIELVNKITDSILGVLVRVDNSGEVVAEQEPVKRIKTLSLKESYSKRDIDLALYESVLKILYVDLPMLLRGYDVYINPVLTCISTYRSHGKVFKRVASGCGGRVCEDKTCKHGEIRVIIAVVSEDSVEGDLNDKSQELFEEFLDDLTYIENTLSSIFNIEKIIYPSEPSVVKWIKIKKSESEAVEVVIREGFDNVVIKLDLRKPMWELNMFPRKIVSEIETLVINPIKKGYRFAPRGILFIGPPGVGKSVLAEAVVSSIGKKILDLKPSVYRSMWYGMTEKILDKLLKSVIGRRDVALLIDDAEFLVSRSLAIHEVHISEISILLNYLQNPSRPITLLTSNTPTLIDQALLRPGRIDVSVVLGYPDRESRRIIIENILRNHGVTGYSEDMVEELVRRTRWFNSAEIDSLIRMALSRGDGKLDLESIDWARRRFKIDPNARAAEQQLLRWGVNSLSNLVIQYIPDENEI